MSLFDCNKVRQELSEYLKNMLIFKKNKVLFDTVKATDATFFKEMMGKFTAKKNEFTKEEA